MKILEFLNNISDPEVLAAKRLGAAACGLLEDRQCADTSNPNETMPPSNKRKRGDTGSSPDQLHDSERKDGQSRGDSKKMVAACTSCRKQKASSQDVAIRSNSG